MPRIESKVSIDIDPSEFGEDFDPSSLDFDNADREKKQRTRSESTQKDS